MKNGIEKRGKTYSYVIRVPDPTTGKTKPKWFGGFPSEQEAKKARDKARVTVTSGTYVMPTKVTVEQYLSQWVEIHAGTLKPKTADDYKWLIQRYVNPTLGKIQLNQLRPSTIQKFYIDLLDEGGQDGKPLSARTVTYVGAVLKKALSYAVDVDGLIPSNVAVKVPMPKGASKKNEPFTTEQMKIFLEAAKSHRLYPLYRLAIYSGARKGELLALKWSDLDFERGSVVISKNRVVIRGLAIDQQSTKGGEGRRNIHIDSGTLEILNSHRKAQIAERLRAGSEWNETGYIFVTEFGLPIDYGTPTQLFTKIVKRLGLPDQRFHDLRHFHATQLLRAGQPLHVVAHRLGHRDAMVTATTYAHVTADQAENVSLVFAKAVE